MARNIASVCCLLLSLGGCSSSSNETGPAKNIMAETNNGANKKPAQKKKPKNNKKKAKSAPNPELSRKPVDWSAPRPKKGNHVFRSQAELQKVWVAQRGNEKELPKIDFATLMVVAMFLDAGEYDESPSVTKIRKENGKIQVRFRVEKAPFKMINPSIVLAIEKDDAEVVFVRE